MSRTLIQEKTVANFQKGTKGSERASEKEM